jgi:formate dehydrogenase gamma subunit
MFATLMALWLFLAPQAGDNAACLACHGAEGMQSESGRDVHVDAEKFEKSAHGVFPCTTCHADVKDYPHPNPVAKVDCATCHTDIVREFGNSIHATARKNGDHDAPVCQTCHGSAHTVVPRADPSSPVSKKNLPDTCGACHANPQFLEHHNIPFARPVEAYRLSVHGRAIEHGNEAAPSCSDCHGSHTIAPARDTHSKINHWNVVETCGACHTEIKKTYTESVHGQAVLAGVRDAPVCTDCHGEHLILAPNEPQSFVNPARVSTVTCGRCHSDERLEMRYNLPTDRVPTFEDSYHGLAMRSGSQTVANCASCHGVHNIFPTSDPRSTVNTANLAETCGKCHAGAGKRFAIGPVHVRTASITEHPVVRWIRLFYLGVIPLTLAFMLLHNALDFLAKLIRGTTRHESGEQVLRMNLHFRIAHWLIVFSFPTLVATGFALKYPESWWAAPLLQWESHFAFRGTIHRIAAVVLVASMVYHLIHLIASRRDRVILRKLLPGTKDAWDLVGVMRHNLGLTRERPVFGKFNYAEKIEYWAFIWGTVVMTVSGLLLWFNNFTLRNFPKWVSDAATAVHFYEAILASLAILIWHFYMVIFDPDVYPMDRAWLTGKASADHLRETRPEYYLALVSKEPAPSEPKEGSGSSEKVGESAENAAQGEIAQDEQGAPSRTDEKKN